MEPNTAECHSTFFLAFYNRNSYIHSFFVGKFLYFLLYESALTSEGFTTEILQVHEVKLMMYQFNVYKRVIPLLTMHRINNHWI